jgi:hypothetical protein
MEWQKQKTSTERATNPWAVYVINNKKVYIVLQGRVIELICWFANHLE